MFVLCSVVCLPASVSFGVDPHLQRVGAPFRMDRDRVQWRASLDDLPATSAVYRVVEGELPGSVLTNLMGLTSFTSKNVSLFGEEEILFESEDEERWLYIMPREGGIDYRDHLAVVLPGRPVEGVPSEEEALRRGLEIVRQLGVERSELATKPGGDEVQVRFSYSKRSSSQDPTAVVIPRRIVTFYRAYEGIPTLGFGGGLIRIEFGNHGKLSKLHMTWRPLEKAGDFPVADQAQFVRWIDEGECVCPYYGMELPDADRLEIESAEPAYLERAYDDDRAKNYVRPVARLSGTLRSGEHETPVEIYCPLVIEGEGTGQTRKEDTTGAEAE